MTIPVQQSLTGFIAGDACLSFTDAGITQVRVRSDASPGHGIGL